MPSFGIKELLRGKVPTLYIQEVDKSLTVSEQNVFILFCSIFLNNYSFQYPNSFLLSTLSLVCDYRQCMSSVKESDPALPPGCQMMLHLSSVLFCSISSLNISSELQCNIVLNEWLWQP